MYCLKSDQDHEAPTGRNMFSGGTRTSDDDSEYTAIRESSEELDWPLNALRL